MIGHVEQLSTQRNAANSACVIPTVATSVFRTTSSKKSFFHRWCNVLPFFSPVLNKTGPNPILDRA